MNMLSWDDQPTHYLSGLMINPNEKVQGLTLNGFGHNQPKSTFDVEPIGNLRFHFLLVVGVGH